MDDELINLKMTSKQLIMAHKKCFKNEKKQLSDVKKAVKQGNKEGARIYAQNAIREKTQAMNYLRLSSRVDAVASRLETAIRTKQVSQEITGWLLVTSCDTCSVRIRERMSPRRQHVFTHEPKQKGYTSQGFVR